MQVRRGLCAVLAVALCLVLSSVANAATGTIDHDGQPLTLASAPSTLFNNAQFTIPDGTQVSIICQSEGQTLSGDVGATSIWDFIDLGGEPDSTLLMLSSTLGPTTLWPPFAARLCPAPLLLVWCVPAPACGSTRSLRLRRPS